MAEVLHIVNSANRQTIPNLMLLAMDRNQTVHLPSDSLLIRRDGLEMPIEDAAAPIHDGEGRLRSCDRVQRREREPRNAAADDHSAEHDFLTGLPNRMLLSDRIGQATLAQRKEKKIAIFLRFRWLQNINDSLGHPIGDRL